jgi:hypothetical protein
MTIVEFLRECWLFIRNRCPVDGEPHCEHYDYKGGDVTFFRCCKCKQRSSFEIEP